MKLLDPHFPSSVSLFPSQAFTQQERAIKDRENHCSLVKIMLLYRQHRKLSETNDSQKGGGKRRKKCLEEMSMLENDVFNKKAVSVKGSRMSLTSPTDCPPHWPKKLPELLFAFRLPPVSDFLNSRFLFWKQMADLISVLNTQYHSTLQLMHVSSESWLMFKGWVWSPRALQLPLHKSLVPESSHWNQNYRVTGGFGMEGTLKITLFYALAMGRDNFQ